MKFLPWKLAAIYNMSPPLSRLHLSSESELTWTLTFPFEKLRHHFDASSVNNLDYTIQKAMHARIKSGIRNPKHWIQKNVSTSREVKNIVKAPLFNWEKEEI